MPAASESDAALVQGPRAGRRDAFARLYGEYHPAIYNLCARIVCDREEAKDLTQEVFMKALAQLPSHDEELKLRPWLYRVATNACYDHLRARKHLDGGDGSVLENTPSQVDEFERSQTVAIVEGTLGQLNERYRTALVLKDLHGMPSEEIATVMEISPSTADVLVHRARNSFKRVFAKLAGDVPAPASLGLVLAPLAVPAALHLVPPMPHAAVAPPSHATVHPLHPVHPGGSGGGLLSKLATAAGSKVAIAAAAATLIAGGVAVRQVRSEHRHATPAVAAAAVRPTASLVSSGGWGWRSWWNTNCWTYGSSWDGRAWPMGDRRSWSNWSGSTWAGGSNSSRSGSWSSGSGSWSSGGSNMNGGKWRSSSGGSGSSGSRQMRSGGGNSSGNNWSGGSGGSSNWGGSGSSGSGSWGSSSGGSGW